MNNKQQLFEIEFLVFSAHKTATQTVVSSLHSSGVASLHCHTLDNIDLEEGEFLDYLKEYQKRNNRKLGIISTFRDPLNRLISSFFQWYGSAPIRKGEVKCEQETIIYKKSAFELQKDFCDYCETIDGWGESIDYICQELSKPCNELIFSEREFIGINDLENCHLYLLRFDSLVRNIPTLLSIITGRKIEEQSRNISDSKWYADRYLEFKTSLQMPPYMIKDIYQSRKNLMQIFYPNQYDSILNARLHQFGDLVKTSE